MINSYKYLHKWTNIGVNMGICLCNNRYNFQLHRFTTSENIAFFLGGGRGLLFFTHTVDAQKRRRGHCHTNIAVLKTIIFRPRSQWRLCVELGVMWSLRRVPDIKQIFVIQLGLLVTGKLVLSRTPAEDFFVA